jgi:hypothetical protein
MANKNNEIPVDPNIDLNASENKYSNEDDDNNTYDNPIQLLNIESPYYEVEQLSANINKVLNREPSFTHISMHLNIQSLPAKFDKLKLLTSELHDQHDDFILLCETFLTDNITSQFNTEGFNLVYTNQSTMARGGVAVYVNAKILLSS